MAGRPPDVTDKEILNVFRQSGDPVLFTGEVADELPIGRDGVRKRLQELEQQGFIQKKQRGTAIVWWLEKHE
jgi:predicted ArsR family transcriptional regulator